MRRQLQPLVWSHIGIAGSLRHQLIAVPLLIRRRDDADIMTAARQHVSDVGFGQKMDLMGRLPGRDVVAQRSDRE